MEDKIKVLNNLKSAVETIIYNEPELTPSEQKIKLEEVYQEFEKSSSFPDEKREEAKMQPYVS